jgi:hypothetical protein
MLADFGIYLLGDPHSHLPPVQVPWQQTSLLASHTSPMNLLQPVGTTACRQCGRCAKCCIPSQSSLHAC